MITPDNTNFMDCGNKISVREFGELFNRYKDKYISIAASYVRDYGIAADIVSDAFATFWDNRDKIELRSVPEAYILQSVRNRCLNHLRDEATRMKIRQQIHTDHYRHLMADVDFLSSEDLSFLFEAEIAKKLKGLLDTLPDTKRDIFIDSRFGVLTYKEISKKRGVTPRKVKRDISEILSLIKDVLSDYLPLLLIFCPNLV